MDRATYLILRKEITLQLLVEKDPDLLNYLAVIPEKGRYGESLFFPNSDEWRQQYPK